MYVVSAVYGYEYHDDYIPLGEVHLTIEDVDVYNMATAEDLAYDFLFSLTEDEWSGWARIDSIVRV